MKNIRKLVNSRCLALANSQRRFEDIYNITFDSDSVMAEYTNDSKIEYYTYGQARRDIDIVAKAIAVETKFKDQFIALYSENCVQWIIAFWAILKSGNKPFLVNLRQPIEFARGTLDTLNVKYIICTTKASNMGKTDIMYEDLLKKGKSLNTEIDVPFGNELAISTSGTTLKEKICIYTGQEISAQVLNSKQAIQWNSEIKSTYNKEVKHLMVLPLYHIFGLEAVFLWFLFFSVIFVFPKSMAPDVLMDTVKKHGVTHIFAVPLLWNAIEKNVLKQVALQDDKTQAKFRKGMKMSLRLQNINHKLGLMFAKNAFREVREKLFGDSVRFCISGGSHIKRSTMELINAIGYPLYNGYGMTEIGIAAVDFEKRPKHRLNPSIGRNFSSVEFDIGEKGSLLVKGFSVCKNIIINKKSAQNEEWFDTGDIVTKDKYGKYHIVGRRSDVVINADGENLNPDLAEKYFDLPDAICFSVLGDEKKENLNLIVQVSKDISSEQKETLKKKIAKDRLEIPLAYQMKQVFYTYDALMDETDIKISRDKINRNIAEGKINLMTSLVSVEEEEEEDSPLKKELRAMMARVLEMPEEKIPGKANFMTDLGGSSLDYFALIGEISETYNIYMEYEYEDFSYSLNDLEKVVKELIKE